MRIELSAETDCYCCCCRTSTSIIDCVNYAPCAHMKCVRRPVPVRRYCTGRTRAKLRFDIRGVDAFTFVVRIRFSYSRDSAITRSGAFAICCDPLRCVRPTNPLPDVRPAAGHQRHDGHGVRVRTSRTKACEHTSSRISI